MSDKKTRSDIIISSAILGAVTLALIFLAAYIFYCSGLVVPNEPKHYHVRGIDVSSDQGKINWELISENIDFAYIKATDGSQGIDTQFSYNYSNVSQTDMRAGYYHFFRFDNSGEVQAQNYIMNVPLTDNMLPPAIDIEFYDSWESNPPPRSIINDELDIMIEKLESVYNMKPIICATKKSYDLYISGSYQDFCIWIRDTMSEPQLSDGHEWTFWQYNSRGKMDGYDGANEFIDLNVFFGTKNQFNNFPS